MPKKKPRRAEKGAISEKQRADDERLRESLRNADLSKFDKLLTKAIVPPKS